jgi:hypothetical protein
LGQLAVCATWIVDYVIVVWLAAGFYKTRGGKNSAVLMGGWAFAAGVFYMALFISLDPALKEYIKPDPTILALIGVMLGLATLGILTAGLAYRKERWQPGP